MADFYWHNRFNNVERAGPFESAEAAKDHVVWVMKQIQEGFAFDIVILEGTRIVENGHIKDGKWVDGDYDPKPGEPGSIMIYGPSGNAAS